MVWLKVDTLIKTPATINLVAGLLYNMKFCFMFNKMQFLD